MNLWMQRRVNSGLNLAQKKTILANMHESGSLEFTANIVRGPQAKIEEKIGKLEAETGIQNLKIRLVMEILVI